jgi:hypothetical protein
VLKPVDIIYEMFVADVVNLEWEIIRWRRLKSSLLKASGQKALQEFLSETLDYELYVEAFTEDLTKILQEDTEENLEEREARQRGNWHRSAPGQNRTPRRGLMSFSP